MYAVDPSAGNYTTAFVSKEWDPKIETLRPDSYDSSFVSSKDGLNFYCRYSLVRQNKIESIINIGRTIFIIVTLGFASFFFTKDAQVLVLDPLERMIEKIKMIA